jgi:hypothetical protein
MTSGSHEFRSEGSHAKCNAQAESQRLRPRHVVSRSGAKVEQRKSPASARREMMRFVNVALPNDDILTATAFGGFRLGAGAKV